MRYAYAYDTSRRLMSELGLTAFPSAILIDPSGIVRWTGHPASLPDATLEAALVGALPLPLWEWPKEASGVRKALAKLDYKAALEAALELEDGQTYVDTVRGVIAGRLGALESAFEKGDFLGASETASDLKRTFKGLPELDRVVEIYERIKDDKAAQEVIKAQKEVAKVAEDCADLKKRKDAEKLLDRLRKVQQKNVGTFAADQASSLADEIRKKLPTLR